jgi:hypothetical protein
MGSKKRARTLRSGPTRGHPGERVARRLTCGISPRALYLVLGARVRTSTVSLSTAGTAFAFSYPRKESA